MLKTCVHSDKSKYDNWTMLSKRSNIFLLILRIQKCRNVIFQCHIHIVKNSKFHNFFFKGLYIYPPYLCICIYHFQVVLHNWLLFEAHMRITRVSFASKNKMNNSNGLEKIIHSWRREEGMRIVQGYTILRNLFWERKKCLEKRLV